MPRAQSQPATSATPPPGSEARRRANSAFTLPPSQLAYAPGKVNTDIMDGAALAFSSPQRPATGQSAAPEHSVAGPSAANHQRPQWPPAFLPTNYQPQGVQHRLDHMPTSQAPHQPSQSDTHIPQPSQSNTPANHPMQWQTTPASTSMAPSQQDSGDAFVCWEKMFGTDPINTEAQGSRAPTGELYPDFGTSKPLDTPALLAAFENLA